MKTFTDFPNFAKANLILKLKSYYFKRTLKAASGTTNGFPKAAANSDKKLETNCIPSNFLKPVHFVINDFEILA